MQDLATLADSDLSTSFVVLDEAHHIVKALASSVEGVKITRALQGSGKALLLTGTPIYNDELDFAHLINIAAGKPVVTTDPKQFHLKYTEVHVLRSAFVGYWQPFISKTTGVVQILSMVMALEYVLPFFPESALKRLAGRGFDKVHTAFGWAMKGFLLQLTRLPVFSQRKREAGTIFVTKMFEGHGKRQGLVMVLLLTTILTVINMLLSAVLGLHRVQLRVLRASQFKPFIREYVSVYNIDRSTSAFARTTMLEEKVTYTPAQLDFFLRFCNGLLSGRDIVQLVAGVEVDKADLFAQQFQAKFDDDIAYGLKIGNLPLQGQTPQKFLGIVNSSKGQPAIVYTNFSEHGAALLSGFLTAQNYSHVFLRQTDSADEIRARVASFNAGKVVFAILDPELTEGLSFKGVRHVHFMEPVMQQAVREQVIARGVRFNSHAHLPPRERTVQVHTWVVEMSNWNFGDIISKLTFWKNFQREYLPGGEMAKHNYSALKAPLQRMKLLTPDII
ncbi:MAG: hypothetical protein EOO77_28765, partial [Oxalobacteraceae bacterium]